MTGSLRRNRHSRNDLLTVVAVSVIAFSLSSIIHEGLGHGGACLAVGCRPQLLTSMNFDGDESSLSEAAIRFIAAGGTLANLLVAFLALASTYFIRRASPITRYSIWLLASINLMQGTGYFLFSGVANFGDWARVIQGLRPWWLWRLVLIVAGGISYWFSVTVALSYLSDFLGEDKTERIKRAQFLMLCPYVVGAVLSLLEGFFNPQGFSLTLVSAVPATLGGTSGLAWGSQLLWGQATKPIRGSILVITRSWIWIVSGLVVGTIFLVVFGTGLTLSH